MLRIVVLNINRSSAVNLSNDITTNNFGISYYLEIVLRRCVVADRLAQFPKFIYF